MAGRYKTEPLRPAEIEGFLQGLRRGNSVRASAEAVGRTARIFYYHKQQDEELARAWDEAYEEGTEFLEDEVRAAVVDGTEDVREVLAPDGTVKSRIVTRRRHPQLAAVLLKKRDPAGYREGAVVQIAAPQAEQVQIAGFQPTTLRDVVRLARELGMEEALEGEVVEEAETPALPAGEG